MPFYLAVYEDSAPFFTYSGVWNAGSSRGDPLADRYSEGSFMVTETRGASFSFVYYGTDVGIYGAKRGNHGLLQGTLDGVSSPSTSGAASPEQFNAALFSSAPVKGFHNVTLTNMEDKFLDIDWVSWKASVGKEDEPLIVNTWQDSHPAFVYSPSNAWTDAPPSVGTFSGATGHGTSTPEATVQVTFKVRDAIALYGPAGPNGASSYSVRVEGNPPTRHSALKKSYRGKQLLYYGANFGPGSHTVTVKLEATSDSSQMLAIDYAEIYTTPSLGGSFDGTSSKAPIGLIVGIAICALIASLGLGFLSFMFYFYKKGRFNFAPSKPQASDTLRPAPTIPQSQQYQPHVNQGGFQGTSEFSPLGLTTPHHTTHPSITSTAQSSSAFVPQASPESSSSGNPSITSTRRTRFGSIRKYRTTNQDVRAEGSSEAAVVPPPSYSMA